MIDVIVGVEALAPGVGDVLGEIVDGAGGVAREAAVQVQGGGVVVAIGQEQAEQLEEAGVLRLPDFVDGGGLAGEF